MGYITVNSSRSPPSLHFAAEMWIFVVLTILLFGVTIAMWQYWNSISGLWRWRRERIEPYGSERP